MICVCVREREREERERGGEREGGEVIELCEKVE